MPAMPEDRQSQLKLLIARGKEQGYLTYAQVNDHLPSEIVDPEQIEDIVNTINDMGIPVYEKAPDTESLLADRAVRAGRRRSDRRSRRRARRARCRARPHHRPGAHVHARDGHGRAADARRRNPHREAHRGRPRRRAHRAVHVSRRPTNSCCKAYEPVKAGQARLVDIIVGFIDPNAPDVIAQPQNPTKIEADRGAGGERPRNEEGEDGEDTEEAVDTGPDPEEAARRFGSIGKHLVARARRTSRSSARKDPEDAEGRARSCPTSSWSSSSRRACSMR